MKYLNLILFFTLLAIFNSAYATEQPEVSKPYNAFQSVKTIQKEYEVVFKSDKDLQDLVRLKDFIQNKDEEFKELKSIGLKLRDSLVHYNEYNNVLANADEISKSIPSLEQLMQKKNIGGKYMSDIPDNDPDLNGNIAFKTIKAYWKNNLILVENVNGLKIWLSNFSSLKTQYDQVMESIQNVKADQSSAEDQVQRIFNVNNNLNNTKLWISLTFAVIILALLGFFFYYLVKISDKYTARLFLTGNGIQFIALFALIISIVLFGVLGILEGRELAAILSGISGFILGKGIIPTETKNNRPPANNGDNHNDAAPDNTSKDAPPKK